MNPLGAGGGGLGCSSIKKIEIVILISKLKGAKNLAKRRGLKRKQLIFMRNRPKEGGTCQGFSL